MDAPLRGAGRTSEYRDEEFFHAKKRRANPALFKYCSIKIFFRKGEPYSVASSFFLRVLLGFSAGASSAAGAAGASATGAGVSAAAGAAA